MRTGRAIRNVMVGIIAQAAGIALSFVNRRVFINFLGYDYLGLTSVLTSVVGILSLLELGAGTAVTCALYKPLAEEDYQTVVGLVRMLGRMQRVAGLAILFLGAALTPFLHLVIREEYSSILLTQLFLLLLLDTAIGFFFSCRRILLIADQNGYLSSFVEILRTVLLNILQVAALVATRNIIIYLAVRSIAILAEGLALIFITHKRYPYMNSYHNETFLKEKEPVREMMRSLSLHNLGNYVIANTGSIVMSRFLTLGLAGIYSNYSLILNTLMALLGQFSNGITASFGNFITTESQQKVRDVFRKIQLMGYLLYSFSAAALFSLFNPFITLWLGEESLLPAAAVGIMVAYFFVSGFSQTLGSLRAGAGLFQADSKLHVALAGANILISVILVNYIGIYGILLATLLCSTVKEVLILPKVVAKPLLQGELAGYYISFIRYLVASAGIVAATYFCCSLIRVESSLAAFATKCAICLLLPNGLNFLLFHKTVELHGLYDIAKKFIGARAQEGAE